MKNRKRITAALFAAAMVFTSTGNDIISYVDASGTQMEEQETPAEVSEETLASEAGMEMEQPEPERAEEQSEQEGTDSEEDVKKECVSEEQMEETEDEESKENEKSKAEKTDANSDKEALEDENLMEENLDLWKEELSKSQEKKDYVILMEGKSTADEIQEE